MGLRKGDGWKSSDKGEGVEGVEGGGGSGRKRTLERKTGQNERGICTPRNPTYQTNPNVSLFTLHVRRFCDSRRSTIGLPDLVVRCDLLFCQPQRDFLARLEGEG